MLLLQIWIWRMQKITNWLKVTSFLHEQAQVLENPIFTGLLTVWSIMQFFNSSKNKGRI